MLLASAGADVISQLDRFKESFLWAAAKGGRLEECESLVQIGADVNWRSPQGDTPLIAACRNGHSPTALCLVDHNAEVNAKAGDGQTALHFSCRHGNEAVAEALIIRGADVFAKNNEGATAFESIGAHVPAGMLRRLNSVAQRQREDHSHVESGPAASALRRHAADSSAGTRRRLSGLTNEQGIKECRARRRHERNQGHTPRSHDETVGSIGERLLLPSRARDGGPGEGGNWTAAGRGGNGLTDGRSVIFSRDGVNDDQEEAHLGDLTVGSTMGDGGEEIPDHRRARDDNHGRSNRTTFPSIAPASAMANTLQRSASATQSESSIPLPSDRNISTPGTRVGEGLDVMEGHSEVQRRGVSRGDPTSGSGSGSGETGPVERLSLNAAAGRRDGWAGDSGDDENINSDLGQRRTSIRLLDGIHRGPTIRQGIRSIGDTSRPESMRLLSAVNSISHAQSAMSSAATSPASTSLSDDSTISDDVIHPGGRIFYSSNLWNDPDDEGNDNIREGIGARAHATAISIAPTTNAPIIAAYSTEANRSSTSPVGRRRTMASGGVEMPAGALEEADAPYTGSSGMRTNSCLQSKPGPMPNDHVGLIRMLWVQEKEGRLAAEAEADAVRFQSTRLWNELVRSEKQVLGLEESLATTREERDMLRATLRGEEVEGRSLLDLETLEKDLRRSLDGVCKERDRILKEQITKDEQRLCVVCQENERDVLLLPCRHLCVCKSCSERTELSSCPLCRDEIVERLAVYS